MCLACGYAISQVNPMHPSTSCLKYVLVWYNISVIIFRQRSAWIFWVKLHNACFCCRFIECIALLSPGLPLSSFVVALAHRFFLLTLPGLNANFTPLSHSASCRSYSGHLATTQWLIVWQLNCKVLCFNILKATTIVPHHRSLKPSSNWVLWLNIIILAQAIVWMYSVV